MRIDGQTDIRKPIFAFRSYTNVPVNGYLDKRSDKEANQN
jgi:hypothetical protein